MSDHPTIGGTLRALREKSGYSISDIEKVTRIPTYILKDLEQDLTDAYQQSKDNQMFSYTILYQNLT